MENTFKAKYEALVAKIGGNEELDELLRMQKEKDIVPVEIEIPVADVVKRYPISEAIEIVKTKTAIFLHSTCYWIISKPTLANNMKGGALYEILTWYCDYQDGREEYSEEEQGSYDTICLAIASILTIPLDAFTDADFMFDLANAILDLRTAYYKRLNDEASVVREETAEDLIANAEFEEKVKMGEQLKAELQEMAEKKASKKK